MYQEMCLASYCHCVLSSRVFGVDAACQAPSTHPSNLLEEHPVAILSQLFLSLSQSVDGSLLESLCLFIK